MHADRPNGCPQHILERLTSADAGSSADVLNGIEQLPGFGMSEELLGHVGQKRAQE